MSQAGAGVRENTPRSHFLKIITSVVFTFTIIISLGVVAFSITFFLSEVDGTSMMQTLNANTTLESPVKDDVLVNRYAQAKPGNIIVVKHYEGTVLKYYIKRLIGVAGDKIRFNRYGTVGSYTYKTVVNDVEIDEWYLDSYWGIMGQYGKEIYDYLEYDYTYVQQYDPNNHITDFDQFIVRPADGQPAYIEVPAGYIFFMGDNRGGTNELTFGYHSYDCTAFGPQPADYIVGVVADIIREKETIPHYVFRKLGYFITLKWIFG